MSGSRSLGLARPYYIILYYILKIIYYYQKIIFRVFVDMSGSRSLGLARRRCVSHPRTPQPTRMRQSHSHPSAHKSASVTFPPLSPQECVSHPRTPQHNHQVRVTDLPSDPRHIAGPLIRPEIRATNPSHQLRIGPREPREASLRASRAGSVIVCESGRLGDSMRVGAAR